MPDQTRGLRNLVGRDEIQRAKLVVIPPPPPIGDVTRDPPEVSQAGQIQQNRHFDALQQYDATLHAMRRIVEALFYNPGYPADEDYVWRRHESSIAPGAWEAVAAARFRRPDASSQPSSTPSTALPYERINVPTLVVEGGGDKLLPTGWAAEIAEQIEGARSVVVDEAGHCPQIEQSAAVNGLLLDFFGKVSAQKM
jgi:2-hydroxymuconate-semialdehyde hydrolase